MSKITVTAWVIPACYKKKWTIMPKVYAKEAHAKSGRTYAERDGLRCLNPVPISTEIECPDCDNCPKRWECYTER